MSKKTPPLHMSAGELHEWLVELLGIADGERCTTDLVASEAVVDAMQRRGYWCQERTPFTGDPDKARNGEEDSYWCGFTPHWVSGWNGEPDHWTAGETRMLARCRAAFATLQAETTKT